jgi:hypothetical protein
VPEGPADGYRHGLPHPGPASTRREELLYPDELLWTADGGAFLYLN